MSVADRTVYFPSCDPPCVPYLGMYLADLAFIEEGTPNYTEDNLVNFSKMRMVSITEKCPNAFHLKCFKENYM